MRESMVEARLTKGVRRMGGLSIKIAPVTAGVPDRLILLPGGRMYLIELKTRGGRLRPIQELFHSKVRETGNPVTVLTGPGEVDEWLQQREKEDII